MNELKAGLTRAEYIDWIEFYDRHPFDDYHRFHRPAALISVSNMAGGDVTEKLEWLAPKPRDGLSDADLATLKAFGLSKG